MTFFFEGEVYLLNSLSLRNKIRQAIFLIGNQYESLMLNSFELFNKLNLIKAVHIGFRIAPFLRLRFNKNRYNMHDVGIKAICYHSLC